MLARSYYMLPLVQVGIVKTSTDPKKMSLWIQAAMGERFKDGAGCFGCIKESLANL